MPPTLRLFAGPPDAPTPSVTVSLGDLLGACGVSTEETDGGPLWLSDFADETVLVSPDLADLLHIARSMDAERRGPSAGPAGPRPDAGRRAA
ncbi:hypothetical protein [Alienimonas californiensis]|uniref:Uncharacterized protein n=1 Tax=Alienimonas californiensis TaxID=2527989 RepID=A0A517PFN6_9PLAN|nr:hypothetical protein [Alienimonas californiensis]QDT18190.1 hypothetical protein CA12_43310 [Alienimonas californiensis]